MSDINREAMNELVKEYSQLPTNTLLAAIYAQLVQLEERADIMEMQIEKILEKMEKGITVTGVVQVSNKQSWDEKTEPLEVKMK